MPTPFDIIAETSNEGVSGRVGRVAAERILAAIDAAGLVITPKEAPAENLVEENARLEGELQTALHDRGEFVVAANIRMVDQNAEIDRLTADIATTRNTALINLKVAQERGDEIDRLQALLNQQPEPAPAQPAPTVVPVVAALPVIHKLPTPEEPTPEPVEAAPVEAPVEPAAVEPATDTPDKPAPDAA